MSLAAVCPMCDGTGTWVRLSHPYSGTMCRDCEYHVPDDPKDVLEPARPKSQEDAVELAMGCLSLLLHQAEVLSDSEKRQTLGKAYFALKFVPSNWP